MVEVKFLGDGYKKKDEKKKKRAWSKKLKKNLIPAGISELVSAMETLTKFSTTGTINCFARYFIERVFDEIRILNYQGHRPAQANKDAFYVSHKLPMWEMHLFSLYDTGNPEFHEIISLSNNKQSYLLKRIAELSPQMAMHLNKINEESEEKVIPLSAISRILSVMVRRPHGSCFDAIAPSLETIDSVAKMSPAAYCDSVFIPDAIPLNQRDDLLIEVSDKIHDLLMEAFVAVMLAGWYELSVIQNLKSQGVEISTLQDPVREMACCTWLETQLMKISSIDELEACIDREFSSFCHINFLILTYMNNRISKIAPWYAYRLKVDDPPVERAAYEFYTDDMDPDTEEVFRNLTRINTNIGSQPHKKEVSQYRIMDFPSEISNLAKEKLSNKPWKKYELRGGLSNVVNFIYRSLNNCCKKIIEEEVKTIPGLDISFRTHRRYNREIKTGALDEFLKKINKLGNIKRVKDLSDEELELYKKYKADRARHHTEGRMSQNQLIKYLQDPEEIAALSKKGILLKKYSTPTLKKKLKILIETGKIKYEPSGRTYHYKEEDKEQIAQAVANL